jgi:hypothetical protein
MCNSEKTLIEELTRKANNVDENQTNLHSCHNHRVFHEVQRF